MESDLTFILNNQVIRTQLNPAIVLLDFIRKDKKLTSTKEVCKEGDCGACAVLLGTLSDGKIKYKTINSCLYPIQKVNGKHVVTLEGLKSDEINLIQHSFIDEGASQCGFCTPGFIISLTGYLLNATKFNEEDAINAVAGNICRCTGYHSIIRSIKNIGITNKIISTETLVKNKIIPEYFKDIPNKLNKIIAKNEQRNSTNKNNERYISGGTDLFVQQPNELLNTNISFIENIVEPYINISDNNLIISGSVTVEELKDFVDNNTNLNLNKLFNLFASLPIRNSATIAGNIINASPIADFTISLLALNAKIRLGSLNGSDRFVELDKFYKAYKTIDKNEEELIKEISFEIPKEDTLFNFEKVSKRTHLDIASVNSAILLKLDNLSILEASISAGGVAPIPLLLNNASEYLTGKTISDETVIDLQKIVNSEISPISDIRGSKEYKILLLNQLIKAHFLTLFPNIITERVLNE